MSMTISQSLLPEFDHEFAVLRKTLERVPEDKLAFQPHAKSMTLARLAGHLCETPMWGLVGFGQTEFDLHPPGGGSAESFQMSSRPEAIARFDQDLAKARTLLAATTDEAMMQPWTLKNHGQVILTLPRVAVARSFLMNHMIHHRAQLGVYLRLLDISIPGTYGPSADEQ